MLLQKIFLRNSFYCTNCTSTICIFAAKNKGRKSIIVCRENPPTVCFLLVSGMTGEKKPLSSDPDPPLTPDKKKTRTSKDSAAPEASAARSDLSGMPTPDAPTSAAPALGHLKRRSASLGHTSRSSPSQPSAQHPGGSGTEGSPSRAARSPSRGGRHQLVEGGARSPVAHQNNGRHTLTPRSKSTDARPSTPARGRPATVSRPARLAPGKSPVRGKGQLADKAKRKPEKTGGGRPSECQEGGCRKRLGLAAYACRCGAWYCPLHVGAHDCGFDYHKAAKKDIKKSHPKVAAKKIDKL